MTRPASADKKNKGVTVAAKLGVKRCSPQADVGKGQLTYFEAVIDRKQQILVERDFVIDLEWPRTQRELTITDELETFVPFAKDMAGDDYAILLGFRLTPEELQYVREHALEAAELAAALSAPTAAASANTPKAPSPRSPRRTRARAKSPVRARKARPHPWHSCKNRAARTP